MKFIDLYAGIGGFRYALESLGHECVFSAEINKFAIETYTKNFNHSSAFNMDIVSDMSDEEIDRLIPDFDILTGGFPCQTFSIGGNKKGFEEARGTQFFNILRIIDSKKPRFIFLENVKHITSHDDGKTYEVIQKELFKRGYDIGDEPLIISPENVGVPQRRERSFMFAELGMTKKNIVVPEKVMFENAINMIYDFGSEEAKNYLLDEKTEWIIESWEKFLKGIQSDLISVVWLDEMLNNEWDDNWQDWKKKYITRMRIFYKENKSFIDQWILETNIMSVTNVKYRRLEWTSGSLEKTLKNKIITIRQSGVRVAKPNVFPTLVASVEVPIAFDTKIKKWRNMSPKEMQKLQSFPKKFKHHEKDYQAYKMFGNSVNVEVIKLIAKEIK